MPTDVGAEEIQVVAHEDGQLRVFEEPNDACPPLVWMLWSLKSLTALSLDSLLYWRSTVGDSEAARKERRDARTCESDLLYGHGLFR